MQLLQRELCSDVEIETALKFFTHFGSGYQGEKVDCFAGAVQSLWNHARANVEIDTIYFNLFTTLFSMREKPQKWGEYAHILHGFDTFSQYADSVTHYDFEQSVRARGKIASKMSDFVRAVVHPSRTYVHSTKNYENQVAFDYDKGIYCAQGDFAVSSTDNYHTHTVQTLVEQSVLWEADALTYNPPYIWDYVHTSGNAALSGIENYKAILSAFKVQEKGGIVSTGEDFRFRWSRYPHELVYVTLRNPQIYGYGTMRWFDEYPVSFAISGTKLTEMLGSNPARNHGSEGITLGSEVPLEAVSAVLYPKLYQEKVDAWTRKNCAHARIISYEALELYNERFFLKK